MSSSNPFFLSTLPGIGFGVTPMSDFSHVTISDAKLKSPVRMMSRGLSFLELVWRYLLIFPRADLNFGRQKLEGGLYRTMTWIVGAYAIMSSTFPLESWSASSMGTP